MHTLGITRATHGCVVMASGAGSRFGGNKLMAELCGTPLVGHVLAAGEGLFDKRVVITRHEDVAGLCQTLGVDVVLHNEPKRNNTVELGMQALGACDFVTFMQGDQPLISAQSIQALLRAAEAEPEFIWRARFGGEPSAPVTFPAWTHEELRALPAGKGGGYVIKAHEEAVRFVEVSSPWELFDVDTRDDLQVLQEHLAKEPS